MRVGRPCRLPLSLLLTALWLLQRLPRRPLRACHHGVRSYAPRVGNSSDEPASPYRRGHSLNRGREREETTKRTITRPSKERQNRIEYLSDLPRLVVWHRPCNPPVRETPMETNGGPMDTYVVKCA